MEFTSALEFAGEDRESELALRARTAANVEAQSVWPFLALAQSEEEFGHRLALSDVQEHLATVAARHGVSVEEVSRPLVEGFKVVLAGRVEAASAVCANCGHSNPGHRDGGVCECGCKSYEPQAKTASRKTAGEQGRGPSYNPQCLEDLPLENHGYNRQAQYTEGYDHGYHGTQYKGYGSRDKAIAYGEGYRHGQDDRSVPIYSRTDFDPQDGFDYPKHPKNASFDEHLATMRQALMEGQDPLEWIAEQNAAQGQGVTRHNEVQEFANESEVPKGESVVTNSQKEGSRPF